MIDNPLSARDLGIDVPDQSAPIPETTELLVPTGKVFPTVLMLGLSEGSMFSRIYDTSRKAELADKGLDTDEIAAIAFEEELRLGTVELTVASRKVGMNIAVQGAMLHDKTGIGYERIPAEGRRKGKYRLFYDVEGEFTPMVDKGNRRGAKRSENSSASIAGAHTPEIQGVDLREQERQARDKELFSHPENIGEEGSPVRIAAELLFSRTLSKRSSSREILLEGFTAQYLRFHPGASSASVEIAFANGLVSLEKELTKIDSAFKIPRSKGNNKDSIVRIVHNAPPPQIEKGEEETPPQDSPEQERDEKDDPIDISVFGQSKTTLLQYLLDSEKPRPLEYIASVRRKAGKSGPLQAAELADAKIVLSTLQLELPEGALLRNPIDVDGKADTSKFELYPKNLTIQQIIELKKNEIEAARIARETEQQRIADENAAREAERNTRFERMRADALAARAEREAAERAALEEQEATTPSELVPDQPETTDERGKMMLESGLLGVVESLVDGEVIKLNRLFEGTGLTLSTQDNGGVGLFLNVWLSLEGDDYSQEALKRTMSLLNPNQIDNTEPESEIVEAEPEDTHLAKLKESGILDVIETAAASTDGEEPSLASAARILIPEKRSRRDVHTRPVRMEPGVSQEVTPKKPETPKEPEVIFRDGKVEMSTAHFWTLQTLMDINAQTGFTPRELTNIKLNGKFKSHDAAVTEKHLQELKVALADTPIQISHPVDEDGIVQERRFIVTIPEGVSIRNFITVK